jgi:hypothetical protein
MVVFSPVVVVWPDCDSSEALAVRLDIGNRYALSSWSRIGRMYNVEEDSATSLWFSVKFWILLCQWFYLLNF